MTIQTDTKPGENAAPEQSTEEAMLAGLDAGIEAAAETPTEPAAEAPAPNAEATTEGDAAPPADEQNPDAAPEGDEPQGDAAKPEGDKKPDGDAKPDADKPKEPDAEIEKEIAERKLQGKTADRFRDLASEVKALAPIRDTLAQAGLKAEDLPGVVKAARDFEGWVGQVLDTGATPEQYGQTLDYLRYVNKDPEKAFELALGEVQALAKALGKDIPGLHDPLADHQDLLDEVQAGDMPRKRALEIAQSRQREALAKQARDAQAAQGQEQNAQRTAAEAAEQGRQDLNTLGAELAKADPHYEAKVGALKPMLAWIRANRPPAEWVQATREAYATIPNPAPAAPQQQVKPPIGHVSGRSGGAGTGPMVPARFDDPMAAMDAGIDAASH